MSRFGSSKLELGFGQALFVELVDLGLHLLVVLLEGPDASLLVDREEGKQIERPVRTHQMVHESQDNELIVMATFSDQTEITEW